MPSSISTVGLDNLWRTTSPQVPARLNMPSPSTSSIIVPTFLTFIVFVSPLKSQSHSIVTFVYELPSTSACLPVKSISPFKLDTDVKSSLFLM